MAASGIMVTALIGLGLAAILVWLSVIDWRRQILPDFLTVPLLAAGLGLAWAVEPWALPERAMAAALGWAALAGLAAAWHASTGRHGLGGGDVKLVAAAGAWVGIEGMAWVVLLGALAGLSFVGVAIMAGGGWPPHRRLPFGPFLAAGFWVVWAWRIMG